MLATPSILFSQYADKEELDTETNLNRCFNPPSEKGKRKILFAALKLHYPTFQYKQIRLRPITETTISVTMHFIKSVLTAGIAIYTSGVVSNDEGSINVSQYLSDSILFISFNYIVSEAWLLFFFSDDANCLIFYHRLCDETELFLLTYYDLYRFSTARITRIVMSSVFARLLVNDWIHRMYKRDLHSS